jgi:hypothetical protein
MAPHPPGSGQLVDHDQPAPAGLIRLPESRLLGRGVVDLDPQPSALVEQCEPAPARCATVPHGIADEFVDHLHRVVDHDADVPAEQAAHEVPDLPA